LSALAGRVILVTRPTDRADPLTRTLKHRGAIVISSPTIEIVPARSASLTRALADLQGGKFEWITLTSAATVDMLRSRLASPRHLKARVAVIGDGTEAAFRRWARREPDLKPSSFTTKALAKEMPKGTGRVLCARADIAPEGLEEALASKGWTPTRVQAYRTRLAKSLPPAARRALAQGRVNAVTFTSASSVRGFVSATRTLPAGLKYVCMGPVTAKQARTQGINVAAVAKPHTMEGMVEALERVFAKADNWRASR
jgi:uroporphyrinogen-III synthase